MAKKYYNHDHIWLKRWQTGNPIWGSYSNVSYQNVVQYVGRLKFPPAKVLDVGCGAGACGAWFQELGYEYLGCDESEEAVRLGRKHFPTVELEQFDCAAETNENWLQQFDFVVSINVLHCLTEQEDRARFLRNTLEYLKPNGFLILTGMSKPVVEGYKQADSPRSFKTKEEIVSELNEVGYEGVSVLDFVPPNQHSNIANLAVCGQKSDY